jgi:opacity protein-like surface antigen
MNKHILAPSLLALALGIAFPAQAQSNEDLLKELRALKDRVSELEKKLESAAKPAPALSAEQSQELSRVATKAEALEDQRDALGFKQLKISGYMDPTFIANRARDTRGFQFLNGVGDDGYGYDNSAFGVVALDFLKETDSGTKFHLTLIPNRGTESVMTGSNRVVHEASVSVPLGDSGYKLLAGHLPDWSGYEMMQPALNKLITHNLLYDLTLPTAYTGAGLEMPLGKWAVKALVANMNTSKRASGERTPVFAYRADYAFSEYTGIGLAGVHGNAANLSQSVLDASGNVVAQRDSRLDLFEVDGFFIRGDLTLQGQASLGRQRQASIVPAEDGSLRDAQWWGLSGLGAYKFTPRLEAALRADFINNKKNGGGLLGYAAADTRNGIGPDATLGCATLYTSECDEGANRYAVSLGLSYLLDPSVILKAEYRYDQASKPVFEYAKDGLFKKSNQLLGASVVVSF